MDWEFRTDCADSGRALVVKHHYSKRWPGVSTRLVGTAHAPSDLFMSPASAACVFGEATARWSEPVLELVRLVREPSERDPNLLTWLISKTVRHIKSHLRDVDGFYPLLVSFASIGEGHHGGIYQASSWNYHGERVAARDGLIINGTYWPARSCNAKWGTSSPRLLQDKFPDWDIESHMDEGKHLYWKALSRAGERTAVRLGLQSLPYPKPAKRVNDELFRNSN
jgi:hypothetical protein